MFLNRQVHLNFGLVSKVDIFETSSDSKTYLQLDLLNEIGPVSLQHVQRLDQLNGSFFEELLLKGEYSDSEAFAKSSV